ncbi:hypothetical protein V9T40_001798 [Parthenolecanium corni]|uniref:Kinesin-like protein n=1 Tax=Parthenolecanium corni TaxID=536013 RepID=A0AAN9THR7_9HEMI
MARKNSTTQRRFSLASKTGGSSESIFSIGSCSKLDQFGSASSLPKLETETDGDGINVVVRVRPMNTKELEAKNQNVVKFPGSGQILLEGLNTFSSENGPKSKLFSFNVVFEPKASQNDVFNYSGIKKLVSMAVEGFNTTCFCYGQTGSGKTHTLTGPPGMFVRKKMDPFSPDHGLVYRSFLHLFQQLRDRTDVHFVLKASFLEIYNEKVIDLLNPGNRTSLSVRWSKKTRSFFVENLFTVDCEQLDDLQAVLEEGMKNRSVGSHNLNDCSGRSHTILTVHITSEQQMSDSSDVFITKQGKINFVDLAGSEMSKKTKSSGKTLTEANNINKSLMVLGYCISSLSDPKKRTGHIPYRDSKLTKLLADSLAGSGVTLMIACISPASSNVCETLNTLRYAARAKKIRTKPIIVMDPRETLIVSLKREIEALQKENEHLRTALNMNNCLVGNAKKSSETYGKLTTLKPVNVEKLSQMSPIELVDLIKHYAADNEALRKENFDLFHSRDLLMRDHQIVCHENERLIKKLENQRSGSSAKLYKYLIENAPQA